MMPHIEPFRQQISAHERIHDAWVISRTGRRHYYMSRAAERCAKSTLRGKAAEDVSRAYEKNTRTSRVPGMEFCRKVAHTAILSVNGYGGASQRALIWERWRKGETLHPIARLFDR